MLDEKVQYLEVRFNYGSLFKLVHKRIIKTRKIC